MTVLLMTAAALFSGAVAVTFFIMASALARTERFEAAANSARVRSFRHLINGRMTVRSDWVPDARIREGMVYSEVNGAFEIHGGISDEAMRKTFGRTAR